jgi:hypothetical protein
MVAPGLLESMTSPAMRLAKTSLMLGETDMTVDLKRLRLTLRMWYKTVALIHRRNAE